MTPFKDLHCEQIEEILAHITREYGNMRGQLFSSRVASGLENGICATINDIPCGWSTWYEPSGVPKQWSDIQTVGAIAREDSWIMGHWTYVTHAARRMGLGSGLKAVVHEEMRHRRVDALLTTVRDSQEDMNPFQWFLSMGYEDCGHLYCCKRRGAWSQYHLMKLALGSTALSNP